jgi:hypothetical protein
MPKVDPMEIIKYIVQGVSEDITHKKAMAGVGKWNDVIVAKKKKEKSKTPERMSMSPRRAVDIKRKVKETKEAGKY